MLGFVFGEDEGNLSFLCLFGFWVGSRLCSFWICTSKQREILALSCYSEHPKNNFIQTLLSASFDVVFLGGVFISFACCLVREIEYSSYEFKCVSHVWLLLIYLLLVLTFNFNIFHLGTKIKQLRAWVCLSDYCSLQGHLLPHTRH